MLIPVCKTKFHLVGVNSTGWSFFVPKKSGNDGKIEKTPLYLQKSRKNAYKNEKSSSHFLVWS